LLYRPEGALMDPLSDVLSLLNTDGALSVRLEAGGVWAMRFAAFRHLKFGAVLSGACWIAVDGADAPVHLRQGDCYLIANGLPYRISGDLDTEPADGNALFAAAGADRILRYGTEDPTTVVIGGSITFDELNARLLLDALPPLVTVRGSTDPASVLSSALELLAYETAAPRPGAALMTGHLARILFVQALRAHLASPDAPSSSGWLGALADPQIGAALSLMHQDVARRWTVRELAAAVTMSRSGFADRFKALVGVAPIDYLLQRRMQTAGKALRDGDRTVSVIATAWGYSSESAFSNAFKRVMGQSPGQYRRAATPVG
jgi:AraC-like DNA-binding protein